MKEYIECEAICKNCNNKDICFPYPEMRAKCPVYKTPAADVEPVRHGEWKYYTIGITSYCECSICGENSPNGFKTPFCPNCGARMDGGNSNG